MAQWFRGGPGSGGRGPQDLTGAIQELIQALGASTFNTNQQMGLLATNLGAVAQATNQNIKQLGQTMQQGSGPARSSETEGAGGYLTLKAKKQIIIYPHLGRWSAGSNAGAGSVWG